MRNVAKIVVLLIYSNSFSQSAFTALKKCEQDSINGMKVFQVVEDPPEYEGGLASFYGVLAKNIKMPNQMDSVELRSKFYISFVIDTFGNMENFCATDIMQEVINDDVINKLNNWKPGTQRGEKVPVRMQLPIIVDYYK